jgi:hypothetical protein
LIQINSTLSLSSPKVWTQCLMLTRKAFYHLNHTPALFCFSYFSDRVFSFCSGLATDHDPSTYSLPCSWDHKHMAPCPACWMRWGLANFLPWLASNHKSPK